jgi:hypothetical protein
LNIFDDFNHVVALFNCSNFPQSFLIVGAEADISDKVMVQL